MLRALGNIDQLDAAVKTIACLMQPLKQTVEEVNASSLLKFIVTLSVMMLIVTTVYAYRRKKRKTEDVDLSLWQTPALSGLAGPTYRCYAKKPTLPLWHA